MERRPHHRNTPGDFYIEEGCSVICGTSEAVAPELFTVDDQHCFVKRQPTTDLELDAMLEAMHHSCVECIRWKGRNPMVRQKLMQRGLQELIDHAE